MQSNKKYINYTWFIFIMVMLVIIAGAVVRMTQSGMGCPDWPKCFGMWVPPTNASQLPPDFEKYLKAQDIDHTFNVYHTWIEYINRLLGALLGVFIIGHFVFSFRKFWKNNRVIVLLSFLLLVAVGVQGWLGKQVVDANLAVVKITIHMIVALLIAAIPLIIISKLSTQEKIRDTPLSIIATLMIVIILAQIILGTQVREQIDEISKSLNYSQRELWIERLDNIFIIHRSFSWLVLLGSILLFIRSKKYSFLKKNLMFVMSCVLITIALGLIMAYLNMPALAQPLHLLLASLLLLSLVSLRLKLK